MIRLKCHRHLLVCSLALLALLGACADLGVIKDSTTLAVEAIDRARRDLVNQSSSWQSTLGDLEGELIDAGQSTIANEVNNLAQRGIATSGVEFRCLADFIQKRMTRHLDNLKRELLGQSKQEFPPEFCQVVPAEIDLRLEDQRRNVVTYHGYDLNLDGRSQVSVVVRDANGQEEDVTAWITMPTHYLMTIPIGGGTSIPIKPSSQMLIVRWGNTNLSSMSILQPEPEAPPKIHSLYPASTTFIPGGGGEGGTRAELVCPPNHVVSGFSIRAAERIDQIRLQCSFLNNDGTLGNSQFTSPMGGMGGQSLTISCPSNTMVSSVSGRAGDRVDRLEAVCTSVISNESHTIGPAGAMGGFEFRSPCPHGYFVTGVIGRAAQEVDQINFYCTEILVH
jgi:hypothetical protein